MKTITQKRSEGATTRSGFTLIELLIVIAIIAALALISFPAAALVMNQAKKTQAASQVANIENAIKLFEADYGVLPPVEGASDTEKIETDSDFIDILTGQDKDLNPKGITYLEGKEAKKAKGDRPARSGFINEGSGSQSVVDPWGNRYVVMLDIDGDGQLKVPGNSDTIRTAVGVWSYGKPDDDDSHESAKTKEPSKWIRSW